MFLLNKKVFPKVCQGWNGEGKVTSYTKPTIDNTLTGHYKFGDTDQYAYICSEYILYTITESGLADVYLDNSDGDAIANKWTYVDRTKPVEVTYPHIYTNHYTDQNGGVWAATKTGNDKDYTAPTTNGQKVASKASYSVTVKLAGVTAE